MLIQGKGFIAPAVVFQTFWARVLKLDVSWSWQGSTIHASTFDRAVALVFVYLSTMSVGFCVQFEVEVFQDVWASSLLFFSRRDRGAWYRDGSRQGLCLKIS